MIICPLNTTECTRPITPQVRTAFVMAPSSRYETADGKTWLRDIIRILKDIHYNVVEGSRIVRHGDYFCSICQHTQGCALGVALVYDGLPMSTIGNIYLETGIMQGFGKPVILFVDKKRNLPSDYIRHYALFLKSRDCLSNYKNLLQDIDRLPDDVYEFMGQTALAVEDYEKAAKYYEEAYLIRPKPSILTALESTASVLEKASGIPPAHKKRLVESIRYFCSKV